MFKKFLSLALITSTMVSLTACSDNSSDTSTTTDSTTTTTMDNMSTDTMS